MRREDDIVMRRGVIHRQLDYQRQILASFSKSLEKNWTQHAATQVANAEAAINGLESELEGLN